MSYIDQLLRDQLRAARRGRSELQQREERLRDDLRTASQLLVECDAAITELEAEIARREAEMPS